jgi:hypothetical protein
VDIRPGASWPCGVRPGIAFPLKPGTPIKVRPCAAISLAGVVDLVAAAETGLGGGAAAALLGGDPAECPDRYRAASPAAMVPLGVPQLLVHGLADTTVPAVMSER